MIQSITIERAGARVYFAGNTFPAKSQIKELGGHWDGDRKAWWVGAAKLAAAESLVAGLAATAAEPKKPQPLGDDTRVLARVKYKGRSYYVVAEMRDMTRCRLTTLDAAIDFWADCEACELVRRYEGRTSTWNGYDQTVYTTLGSLRRFVEEKRAEEKAGVARGEKPDEECYWGGSDWLVRGCAACKAAGMMCRTCCHDIYDH